MRAFYLLTLILLLAAVAACEDLDSGDFPSGEGDADADADTDADADADADTDADADSDTGYVSGLVDCEGGQPLVFKATVRDFAKTGHPTAIINPDFNTNWGTEAYEPGIVGPTLGDDLKPVWNNPGAASATTSDGANFSQWYNTVDGVNIASNYEIVLNQNADGAFEFFSNKFFPLPLDAGWGGAGTGDLDSSGMEQNFRFTTEFRMKFKYRTGQVFTFQGDDDVWVFIDNRRVIDLGGIHSQMEESVNLDTLDLVDGSLYTMDIFHAERNPTGSNFKITTNIECVEPLLIQ